MGFFFAPFETNSTFFMENLAEFLFARLHVLSDVCVYVCVVPKKHLMVAVYCPRKLTRLR